MVRKFVFLSFVVLLVFSCSSDGDDNGSNGGSQPLLIMGTVNQAGVSYLTDITEISFEMTSQSGDSVFYQANLDVDINNSTDIRFELVSWTDNTVLTIISLGGYAITASQDAFEILGTDTSLESARFFPSGTIINSNITGFVQSKNLFISHILNNERISASQSIWNDVAYLPFSSNSRVGWIGLNIEANGTDIQGIGINTIAIR